MLKDTIIYPNDELVIVKNSSGTFNFTYVKHEGQRIAELKPDGSKIFLHPDHLGSSSVVTNESGEALENSSFTPFGEIVEGGSESRYSYTGQEYSSVVSDYDYHARKYKSEWGKFLQPDAVSLDLKYTSIKGAQIFNPQELNLYNYVLNNPYNFIDPNGLWTVQIGGSVTGGFGGGGTTGGGIVVGYSDEGGLQFGGYTMTGGGAYAGSSGSITFDVSHSSNDYVEDLHGDTFTTGGSYGEGLTLGGEVNVPFPEEEEGDEEKKKSNIDETPNIQQSGTFSIGAGGGLTPGEGHAFFVRTDISKWYGKSRSNLKWYYSKSKGTRTWRIGDNKPGGDYKEVKKKGSKPKKSKSSKT